MRSPVLERRGEHGLLVRAHGYDASLLLDLSHVTRGGMAFPWRLAGGAAIGLYRGPPPEPYGPARAEAAGAATAHMMVQFNEAAVVVFPLTLEQLEHLNGRLTAALAAALAAHRTAP